MTNPIEHKTEWEIIDEYGNAAYVTAKSTTYGRSVGIQVDGYDGCWSLADAKELHKAIGRAIRDAASMPDLKTEEEEASE